MEGQGGGFWRKQEVSRGTWRRRVDGDTPALAGAAASAGGAGAAASEALGTASCSPAGTGATA